MEKKIGLLKRIIMGKGAILGGLIASGQIAPVGSGSASLIKLPPCMTSALMRRKKRAEVAQVADIVFGAVKPGIMVKIAQ